MKQIILLPPGTISPEERAHAQAQGVVIIECDKPHQAMRLVPSTLLSDEDLLEVFAGSILAGFRLGSEVTADVGSKLSAKIMEKRQAKLRASKTDH